MIDDLRDGDWPAFAIKLFWKLLTATGTTLLIYVAWGVHDRVGTAALSALAACWLAMFLFTEPDI